MCSISAEGTYEESIHLAAVDVDLIGEGSISKIVVKSVGRPAITFRAAKGTVKNITFKQTGGACDCVADISSVR